MPMNSRRLIAFACAAVVFCLIAMIRSGGADEPVNQVESSPFAGKLLAISVTDQRTGACLEDVEIRKLAGREYFVGSVVPASDSYAVLKGKRQWVAGDAVISMYEFKDLDEMKAVTALMQELQQKSAVK
jgi:hypothetical protein